MSLGKTVVLNNGVRIPQIGLGTWLAQPGEVEAAVQWAVEAGYRHIDCARIYHNQEEVGAALKKVIPKVCKREDIFITSKLWNNSHVPEGVEPALDEVLEQLGLDFIDLFLIHWPVAYRPGPELSPKRDDGRPDIVYDLALADTWRAMTALVKTGKVRAVGVSNFTIEQIKGIIAATGVVPQMNQVEAHPLLPQDDLVQYCEENNIHLTAYSPLGNNFVGEPMIIDYPAVKEVAAKYGATPAQAVVAWGAHRGYIVIPKSVHKGRIEENFKQIELSEEDYERVGSIGIDHHRRFNIPVNYKPSWEINIWDEEAEQGITKRQRIA